MTTRTTLLIILALLIALAGWWLWREWRIERCGDGGGEWNYAVGACGPRAG